MTAFIPALGVLAAAVRRADLLLAAIMFCIAGAPARADLDLDASAPSAVSRAVLERHFFHEGSDTYVIGDRVYRWDRPLRILIADSARPGPIDWTQATPLARRVGMQAKRVLDAFPGPGLVNFFVGAAAYPLPRYQDIDLVIHIDTDMRAGDIRFSNPWRGREAYETEMRAGGCLAYADVPYKGRAPRVPPRQRRYRIENAYLRIGLSEVGDTLDDCAFRGMAIVLGLHLTPEFAFQAGAISEDAKRDALDALSALYHPAVRTGMTCEAFVSALARAGAIGE